MVLDRLSLLRGRLERLKEGLFRREEADGPGFRWRYFLKVFLLLLLAQVLISSWPYYTTMRQLRLTVETNERYIVQMEREFIHSHFAVVFTDIEYLVQSYRLVDASMRNPAARNAHLEQQYLNFLKNKGIYDQARIIDLRGMETVRTNYNDGKPAVIPRQQLQMKSDRYYFKEGIKLRERELYISPLDLNIEHGTIEYPLKPMIRFVAPVYNSRGVKEGLVVMNYLGSVMIENMRKISREYYRNFGDMDSVLMLLNEGGYFLMGSVPHEEWGFMFPDKKHLRFNYRHPEAWERITREKDGSLYTERGLYTFASVSPYPENGALKIAGEGTSWRIVSFAPRAKLASLRAAITRRYIILNILFMLISVVVASAITALRLGKKAAEEKLRLLAATDPLTALLNRRAFLDRFEYERVRSMRYDEPVSVIMGDIDHFKQVNDSKGHRAGDYVLKTIGTILKSNLREQDSVCRWGGEEFIVMLPQTGVRNAVETAEKLRKIIEAYGFVHDGSRLNVTISFGVALCRRGMSVEECIHMADRMMYQSKAGGRNRVSHEHRH